MHISDFFKRKRYNYTNEQLLAMGGNLINKVIILKSNAPYDKVLISKVVDVKTINDNQYIELNGYTLSKKVLSILIPVKTYIRLIKSNSIIEPSIDDEIYLKDITEMED